MPTSKTETLLRELLETEEHNYNLAKNLLSKVEEMTDDDDKEDVLYDALRIYMENCIQTIGDITRKLKRYEKM